MSLQRLMDRRDKYEASLVLAKKNKDVSEIYKYKRLYHKSIKKLEKFINEKEL